MLLVPASVDVNGRVGGQRETSSVGRATLDASRTGSAEAENDDDFVGNDHEKHIYVSWKE